MELEVVPILNKIDLPVAEPERVAEEIEEIVGIDAMKRLVVLQNRIGAGFTFLKKHRNCYPTTGR